MDEKQLREMAKAWALHDWEEYAFTSPGDLETGYFEFAMRVLAGAGVSLGGPARNSAVILQAEEDK
jgi:hypothetical protein